MNRHDPQPEPTQLPAELAALDAELQDAMRVAAPRELVERIEVALCVYDPSLEAALRRELGVDLPDEVADEIASAVGLADVQLDTDLRTALAADAAPSGMSDRIATACGLAADALEAPPVIARIGFTAAWRTAIAAALIAALSLGVYLASVDTQPVDMDTKITAAQIADLEQGIVAALETETPAPASELDEEFDALFADIDALTVALAFGSDDDPLDAYTDQLEQELDLIENHLGSF